MQTRGPLTCQLAVKLLDDYRDGALYWADRERVRAHLRRCAGCSAALAQLQQAVAWLGQLAPPTIEPAARAASLGLFRAWQQARTAREEWEG